MSALETTIWNILGYTAMPTIFIAGFIGVFLVALTILNLLGEESVDS